MERNIFDNHLHSQFSVDSRTTLKELTDKAIERHLAGIAITDHLDIDAPRKQDEYLFDIAEQQKEIDRLQAEPKIKGTSLKILKGIEIGLQPETYEKNRKFVAGKYFDTVIASVHFIDQLDPFYHTYYKDKTYKQAYGHALETIYETAIEYKDFDILGHFDYVARYAPYEVRDITYREFGDYLDPILKFLAEEGKALEINTKSYRLFNGHEQLFDDNILKRFRELGGEALSLGSDSHDALRVAENFEKYVSVAIKCGFRYLVHYEHRKPVFEKISDNI
ncbi:MAG: histidinol-phosphatase HisJ family protein [Bacteroidales bacterium]|jgi:histidinol-phosphatase (PHP family)|nr:histidinol-phosphatase HisJ family protein [Bacteroidales bacterium]